MFMPEDRVHTDGGDDHVFEYAEELSKEDEFLGTTCQDEYSQICGKIGIGTFLIDYTCPFPMDGRLFRTSTT